MKYQSLFLAIGNQFSCDFKAYFVGKKYFKMLSAEIFILHIEY